MKAYSRNYVEPNQLIGGFGQKQLGIICIWPYKQIEATENNNSPVSFRNFNRMNSEK